ncbi:MAG: hypothetical protein HYY40_07900 [Bacteroidetes bacterium]|nr:hypothetical protein [Bacteroidota bacterium]
MHAIEPYDNWRNLYIAEEDERSPFYGRKYSEFEFLNSIYDHYIHPQWDDFGSSTLYLKILYADYDDRFAIIELLGEWNDYINNDIMFLKRNVIEKMTEEGIRKFVLIGENILNFHSSDDSYYQEWSEETEGGWIALLNVRPHILGEIHSARLGEYIACGEHFSLINWRTYRPLQLQQLVEQVVGNERV